MTRLRVARIAIYQSNALYFLGLELPTDAANLARIATWWHFINCRLASALTAFYLLTPESFNYRLTMDSPANKRLHDGLAKNAFAKPQKFWLCNNEKAHCFRS